MSDDNQQYLKDAVALVTQLADAEHRGALWTDTLTVATESESRDVMVTLGYLTVKALDALAGIVNAWPATEPQPFDVGELPADVSTLLRKIAPLK